MVGRLAREGRIGLVRRRDPVRRSGKSTLTTSYVVFAMRSEDLSPPGSLGRGAEADVILIFHFLEGRVTTMFQHGNLRSWVRAENVKWLT
jgi:hypothetical protein